MLRGIDTPSVPMRCAQRINERRPSSGTFSTVQRDFLGHDRAWRTKGEIDLRYAARAAAEARLDAEAEADVAAGRIARVSEWLKRLANGEKVPSPRSVFAFRSSQRLTTVKPFGGYRASVQLSHKPKTQVLEGTPSRCLGQGRPWASIPLWVSRAPSAGTSTVHIP